jgi:hypothetical protein
MSAPIVDPEVPKFLPSTRRFPPPWSGFPANIAKVPELLHVTQAKF